LPIRLLLGGEVGMEIRGGGESIVRGKKFLKNITTASYTEEDLSN